MHREITALVRKHMAVGRIQIVIDVQEECPGKGVFQLRLVGQDASRREKHSDVLGALQLGLSRIMGANGVWSEYEAITLVPTIDICVRGRLVGE